MRSELKESLDSVLRGLSDDRLREVLDFATFLSLSAEREAWTRFSVAHLENAYGEKEPEYSEADIKAKPGK